MLGWGNMLPFILPWTDFWCYVTMSRMGGGVGWDNMLRFILPSTDSWCYVKDGVGWAGMVSARTCFSSRQTIHPKAWEEIKKKACSCRGSMDRSLLETFESSMDAWGRQCDNQVISALAHQWAWRQPIGSQKPKAFLQALEDLLKRWEKWGKKHVAHHPTCCGPYGKYPLGNEQCHFEPRPSMKRVPSCVYIYIYTFFPFDCHIVLFFHPGVCRLI